MSENITLTPADYVLIRTASIVTGLSVKAIERKIETGTWLEGREYRRAPDGRIYISIKGFQRWVEQGQQQGSKSGANRSGSNSPMRAGRSAAPCA